MRWGSLVTLLVWSMCQSHGAAQMGPATDAPYLKDFVGTYTGRLEQLRTDVRVIVAGSQFPGVCGQVELTELGCRGVILDCTAFERDLRFEQSIEPATSAQCAKLASSWGSLEHTMRGPRYAVHLGLVGPAFAATQVQKHPQVEVQPAQAPIVVPHCKPTDVSSEDVSGDFSYGSAAQGEATIKQKGSCVTITARWKPLDLEYVAQGALLDGSLKVNWRVSRGKGAGARGAAVLALTRSGLVVKDSRGSHVWRGALFKRLKKPVALPICQTLLLDAEQAVRSRKPDTAHVHLKALNLLLSKEDANDTRFQPVMRRAGQLQARLPRYAKGEADLAWQSALVLLERANEARSRGDKAERELLVNAAESAAESLAHDQNALISLLRKTSTLRASGEFFRRTLASSSDERFRRADAKRRCNGAIAKARLDEATSLCADEDALLKALVADHVERSASLALDIETRSMMKVLEAAGEKERLSSLSERQHELEALAADKNQTAAVRKRALAWATSIRNQLTESLSVSGTLQDLPTAANAVQAEGSTFPQSFPTNLQVLAALCRAIGFAALLDSAEAVEHHATWFALQSGIGRENALQLLFMRKGKGHSLEAQIVKAARRDDASEYDRLRRLRGALSAAYLAALPSGGDVTRADPIRREIFTLEDVLAKSAARWPDEPRDQPPTAEAWVAALAAALPSDGVWLNYQRYRPFAANTRRGGEDRYALFAVRGRSRAVDLFDLGVAKTIDAAVENFRATLRNTNAADADVRYALHEAVEPPDGVQFKLAA